MKALKNAAKATKKGVKSVGKTTGNLLVSIVASNLPAQSLTKKLILTMKSGENLMAKDDNGKSDPYCMINYLGSYWKTTKVISETLNPVWDQSFEIELPPDESVEVFVWDKDMIGSSFLGYTKIDLKEESNFGGDGKNHVLGPRPNTKDEITSGSIKVGLDWITNTHPRGPEALKHAGAVQVTILQAKSLNPSDNHCDPYCKVTVGKNYQKTKIIRGYLNPEWNETFYFPQLGGSPPETIEFEVKDDNLIASNTSLGSTIFPASSLKPGEPMESWLPLTSAKTGMVLVRIIYYPDAFARESKTLVGVKTTKKLASASVKKIGLGTKNVASVVFIKVPTRVVVSACLILRDRLKRRGYEGSVKGSIGFPNIYLGWNSKTSDTKVGVPQHIMSLIEKKPGEETEEDKEHEKMLSKLVGLVADRLLDVAKIMSHQMQEMNVSGGLGLRLRCAYLGPPTPGTAGLPTPIKFTLGIKIKTDSIPRTDIEPEIDDLNEMVLSEQADQIANLGEADEKNQVLMATAEATKKRGCLRVSVLKASLTVESEELKPYVGVTSGDNYLRTKTVLGSTPVWNEELAFPVDDTGLPPPFLYLDVAHEEDPSKYLIGRLYSHLSSTFSAQLGYSLVNLSELNANTQQNVSVGLYEKVPKEEESVSDTGPNGSLQLALTYEPDALAPEPSGPKSNAVVKKSKDTVVAGAGQVKEKGAIKIFLRFLARVLVYAALSLRKRCKERKFEGEVCTYYNLGPFQAALELSTEDTEVQVKKKMEDALPGLNSGEVDKVQGTIQKLIDAVVDLLLNGIQIGCREMQRRRVKGNVWFGQDLIIPGLPAEILVGLYINSESAPPVSGMLKDIDLTEVLSNQADEAAKEENPKKEAEKKEKPVKKGALKVTVLQGRSLEVVDDITSSTYVRVKVGEDKLYSEVVYDQGPNPSWAQTFVFPYPEADDSKSIDIKVYDDNIFYSDVNLGVARLDITDLKPLETLDQWLPLAEKKGQIRIAVTYDPEAPAPKITYPSIFGKLASGTASTFSKSGRKAGKGSVRLGFQVAILSATIARDKIKDRGYKGKGMTSVSAILWSMSVTLSSKDSKTNQLEVDDDKKEPSAVVKVLRACVGKCLDIIAVGAEEVQSLGTQGALKVRVTAGLPYPLAEYFGVSTGLAVETDSITDHLQFAPVTAISNTAQFGIEKVKN